MARFSKQTCIDLNKDLAEFIGIIIGDGHINKKGRNYYFKIVGNPVDEIEYYEFVADLASKILSRKIKPRLQDKGRSYGISFNSNLLGNKLISLGIPYGKKSDIVYIPDIISSNDDFVIPCLRGIFDTDGCLTLKKRYRSIPYYPVITFKSASKKLITQISKIMINLGIKHSLVLNHKTYDKRSNKIYTGNYLHINGYLNVSKWFKLIGTSHPKIKRKFISIKFGALNSSQRIYNNAQPVLIMIK